MIFGKLFEQELWSRSASAGFYDVLDLKDVVRITRPLRGVCSTWTGVIRDLFFSRPQSRRNLLVRVDGDKVAEVKQLFPRLKRVVLCLGDPNDARHLERLHVTLTALSREHTMNFIAGVAWKHEPTATCAEWPLPLGEGCIEKAATNNFGPVFGVPEQPGGGPVFSVNEWVIEFMYRELQAYARYHAKLVLSLIGLMTAADYVAIPAFVFTALAGPALECTSTAMKRIQRARLPPTTSFASLPSARYVEIHNGPHALHRTFTRRFLAKGFRPLYHLVEGQDKWTVRRYLRDELRGRVSEMLSTELGRVCQDLTLPEPLRGSLKRLSVQSADKQATLPERQRVRSFLTDTVLTELKELRVGPEIGEYGRQPDSE